VKLKKCTSELLGTTNLLENDPKHGNSKKEKATTLGRGRESNKMQRTIVYNNYREEPRLVDPKTEYPSVTKGKGVDCSET